MNAVRKAFIMPHPPIIVPGIGMGREKEAQKTIDGCLKAASETSAQKPETIIVISPHGSVFRDAICISTDAVLKGDFGGFGHKSIEFEYKNDTDLCEAIISEFINEGIPMVQNDKKSRRSYKLNSSLDHGALVPLYFINQKYNEYKLVHMAYGMLNPRELYRCGMAINRAVAAIGRNAVVIASGDLSHRLTYDAPSGYAPEGQKYDEFVVSCIAENKFLEFLDADSATREKAGECGHRSISMMLGVFEGRSCKTGVFSYEGPFGVGYMAASIEDSGTGTSVLKKYTNKKNNRNKRIKENESQYVKLARETIEEFVKTGKTHESSGPGSDRKGTFVSIKKNGILRGCIGTIGPTTDCIENEIIDNAIKAATKDPRFPPITEDELENLVISVDILFEAEKIDSRDMLDVKEYGVIVSKGYRRGLLLPNLEGVDTIDEQIRITLSKAEISPDEEYDLARFRVVRHK